jgi:hypothetical protein
MAITAKEYLDWWNSHNPGQRATIDQIEPCECGYPTCRGWCCCKKDNVFIGRVFNEGNMGSNENVGSSKGLKLC